MAKVLIIFMLGFWRTLFVFILILITKETPKNFEEWIVFLVVIFICAFLFGINAT